MTTRVLTREEWPRLAGTEAETVWPHLNESAQILVVEQDGEIKGCWILMAVAHVECLWKAPDAGAGVARRLLMGMRKLANDWGTSKVWTSAMSDDVRTLLHHRGAVPVPGDHFMMELR